MSKIEKLLTRLYSKPKDFTYQELKTLLEQLGFIEYNKGKTSGSRVKFKNERCDVTIELHKPHNTGNILKPYQIKNISIGIGLCREGRGRNG